jgi:hypothetical protein
MRRFLVAQRSLQRIRLRVRRQAQVLLDELSDFLNQRIETRAFFIHDRSTTNERRESSVAVFDAHSGCAFAALDHDLDLSILLFLRLKNAAQRADAVDLLWRRLVNGGVVLSGQKDCAIPSECLFQGSNGTGTTDFECNFSKGKYDDVADRHHWVPGYVGGGSV